MVVVGYHILHQMWVFILVPLSVVKNKIDLPEFPYSPHNEEMCMLEYVISFKVFTQHFDIFMLYSIHSLQIYNKLQTSTASHSMHTPISSPILNKINKTHTFIRVHISIQIQLPLHFCALIGSLLKRDICSKAQFSLLPFSPKTSSNRFAAHYFPEPVPIKDTIGLHVVKCINPFPFLISLDLSAFDTAYIAYLFETIFLWFHLFFPLSQNAPPLSLFPSPQPKSIHI